MSLPTSKIRGVTIVEVTMGLAVTGVLVAASAQALIGLRVARRSHEHRALAIEEVSNLMERVQVVPWEQLAGSDTANDIPGLQLSDQFQEAVSNATLTIELTAVDDPAEAVKISIAIVSVDAGGREVPLASLTAWRYRFEEE